MPKFALQVERTVSIYWQAYFCTVCVYFLFPQHHGNDRFYMTSISMGQFKPTSLYPLSTCVFNSSKMETLVAVCEGRTIVYWWVAGLLLHQSGCERTLLLGGQTSGQQSATRALPRTGRGRLPHTERVIPNKNFTYEIKVAWKYCNCLMHGQCGWRLKCLFCTNISRKKNL